MDTSGDLFATALSHMEADADADAPGPASARGGPPPHAYGPGSASRLANSDTLDSREGERAAAPALAGSSPAPGAGGGSSAAEDCMVSCADQSAAAIMARSQPGILEGGEAEDGVAGSGHPAGTDPKGGGDQGAQARGGNSRAPARGPVCAGAATRAAGCLRGSRAGGCLIHSWCATSAPASPTVEPKPWCWVSSTCPLHASSEPAQSRHQPSAARLPKCYLGAPHTTPFVFPKHRCVLWHQTPPCIMSVCCPGVCCSAVPSKYTTLHVPRMGRRLSRTVAPETDSDEEWGQPGGRETSADITYMSSWEADEREPPKAAAGH